jgi:hypothetical protein
LTFSAFSAIFGVNSPYWWKSARARKRPGLFALERTLMADETARLRKASLHGSSPSLRT